MIKGNPMTEDELDAISGGRIEYTNPVGNTGTAYVTTTGKHYNITDVAAFENYVIGHQKATENQIIQYCTTTLGSTGQFIFVEA